jgi:N-hydroxyarylamine O-acetyltransferase
MLEEMFDPDTLDLDAYLERIGYAGSTPPTLATLESVALDHPAAIPFENLDPYLRRPVGLDLASIQGKLVHGGRGGWCFEHNILLGTALTALGFRAQGLGARVLWNAPPGPLAARSHMVLLLELSGSSYIVDAGFGGVTLTAPLRLEAETVQDTPHGRFRLLRVESDFVMQADIQGSWRSLYRFDLQPQRLADYEVANWYLGNHPGSHFLLGVIAARVDAGISRGGRLQPARRHTLRFCDMHTHEVGGPSRHSLLASGGELRAALRDTFRINVPSGDEVDAALERQIGATLQQT